MDIDKTDLAIIQLLRENGRITHEAISQELGMTRPAIHKRVEKLTASGVIEKYSCRINWDQLGYPIYAMINIWVKASDFHSLIDEIKDMATPSLYIESCVRITGQYSLVLYVRAKSTMDVTILHDKLLANDGVKETLTSLILDTAFPDAPLIIE